MAAPKGEALLAEAIKTGNFDPVYCLFGDNDFRKEEALRQILATAIDPVTRDFNVDVLRGSETDASTLETALGSVPMIAERRVVVLRDPGALKKQPRCALDAYLAKPAADTTLVLVYPSGSDVPAVIERRCVSVKIEALGGERLIKWIVRQAKTAHATEITRDAAELLHEAVGDDLMELASELDKLSSYSDGSPIDSAAVTAVVGVRPGETLSSLLDAVADRDPRRALLLTGPVLRQPKITGVTLVMALAAQTLGIGWCRARRDAGAASSLIQREVFGVARRVAPFLDPRPFATRATVWVRASADWSAADVESALNALLAADVALKETRVASEEQIVSTAVLAACAGSERTATAA
ncbi:DNA polymerase III subunit delta [soil metagenome]